MRWMHCLIAIATAFAWPLLAIADDTPETARFAPEPEERVPEAPAPSRFAPDPEVPVVPEPEPPDPRSPAGPPEVPALPGEAPAPEAPPPQAPAAEAPQTSQSVAASPREDGVHARVREAERPGEWALWIPRVVLFPLRVVVTIVGWPISKALHALEVYALTSRVKSIFFNEDGTLGLFPVGFAETGFGLNVGARLIVRRLGGTDLGFTARASFGGRFRQLFSTKLSTNKTFAKVTFDGRASYEIRPKDQFFGIGNGDVVEVDEPIMAIDARSGELRASRFRQDAVRLGFATTYRPHRTLAIAVSGLIVERDFADAEDEDEDEPGDPDDDDDEQLATNFDVATVNRFVEGSSTMYGEIEATFDTRHAPSRWESAAVPSAGWYLQGFTGYALGYSGDPTRYIRYGLDLQRYLRLSEGPRALALRVYLEGITAGYRKASFYDLPHLGGPLILRGYSLDQFRDRFAGMTSVEYLFDASDYVAGFLFVDAGRVFAQPEDVSLSDLRVGFGGGIQIHSKKQFLGRFTVASSRDGGLFLTVSFDPVYDTRARVERR